jgi:hypothetical protein
MATASLDPRAFWIELYLLCKLYALYLAAVTIYTVFSLSRMLVGLHSFKKVSAIECSEQHGQLLVSLQNKSENLHRLTFFSGLLFGMVFFLQFPAVFRGYGDSNETGLTVIVHGLLTYSNFAACVFLLLLILHVAEWIVSARLRRLTLPH